MTTTTNQTVWAVSPRGDMRIAHAQTPEGNALCRASITLSPTVSSEDLDRQRYGMHRCIPCVRKLDKQAQV